MLLPDHDRPCLPRTKFLFEEEVLLSIFVMKIKVLENTKPRGPQGGSYGFMSLTVVTLGTYALVITMTLCIASNSENTITCHIVTDGR